MGEYLQARGDGPDVPLFLRYSGENAIRNKRMSRRDCAMFVRDVWRDKIETENSAQESVFPFSPFILAHVLCARRTNQYPPMVVNSSDSGQVFLDNLSCRGRR